MKVSVSVFLYLFLMISLHTGDSSKRSLRLSLVTITPSVFCASCSISLWRQWTSIDSFLSFIGDVWNRGDNFQDAHVTCRRTS